MMTDTETKAVAKFTAEQIDEKNCPTRLRQIGREIHERLTKVDKRMKDAEDHLISVGKLLDEAKSLCDNGGFKKFQSLFCPHLGKSQSYALRAVVSGRKSLTRHREEERDRKRRTRAKQKEQAAEIEQFRDVPENRTGTSVNAKDNTLLDFAAKVMELHRITDKQKPERYAATTVPPERIEQLGKFLTGLAALLSASQVEQPAAA